MSTVEVERRHLLECCLDSMTIGWVVSTLISCREYLLAGLYDIGDNVANDLFKLHIDEKTCLKGGADILALVKWI